VVTHGLASFTLLGIVALRAVEGGVDGVGGARLAQRNRMPVLRFLGRLGRLPQTFRSARGRRRQSSPLRLRHRALISPSTQSPKEALSLRDKAASAAPT
jgi:hypothetical protein